MTCDLHILLCSSKASAELLCPGLVITIKDMDPSVQNPKERPGNKQKFNKHDYFQKKREIFQSLLPQSVSAQNKLGKLKKVGKLDKVLGYLHSCFL